MQGLDYFYRFTRRFPDVRSLAEADEDEVMKYWQGLGYYSRARNLHAAARQIMDQFGGVFPRTREEVLSLKGIGVTRLLQYVLLLIVCLTPRWMGMSIGC